jgi:hypothetical protein
MCAIGKSISVLPAFLLILGACGGGEAEEATSSSAAPTTSAVTTTTTLPTTTTPPPGSTSTEETTSTSPTSTTAPESVEVATVVSWIQQRLDDEFARSDPPEGVLGAIQLECDDTNTIKVGGVLACRGVPQSDPDFPLDPVGVVIYVLDVSGRAAFLSGTDLPDTTAALREAYEQAEKGLFCRDLLSPGTEGGLFNGSGRPPEDAFLMALVYWSLEGEPDRMDADGNGIPCETLYDAEVIDRVLNP